MFLGYFLRFARALPSGAKQQLECPGSLRTFLVFARFFGQMTASAPFFFRRLENDLGDFREEFVDFSRSIGNWWRHFSFPLQKIKKRRRRFTLFFVLRGKNAEVETLFPFPSLLILLGGQCCTAACLFVRTYRQHGQADSFLIDARFATD